MDSTVDISVIILNYNTFELTKACIASIYKQTTAISFEIIVVDNASKEREIESLIDLFPEIQLILSETNLGFAKGNNLGISYASGNSILLLNSDTVLLNNAIGICYQELHSRNEIGVITCRLEYPDGTVQHQCRAFETLHNYTIEKCRIHKFWSAEKRARVLLNGYFDHESEMITERIWGTFFLFKREILESLPEQKLADRFFMYGEDNEWCYQVAKYTPYKILYYPEARVLHYGGGSEFDKNSDNAKANAIKANKRAYMSDYYGKYKTKLLLWLKGE